MATKKVRVSDLPQAQTLDGLWILGVTDANDSVKAAMALLRGLDGKEVSLRLTSTALQWRLGTGTWQNLMTVADIQRPATDAAALAAAATANANTATANANAAKAAAETATANAITAIANAIIATNNANTAKEATVAAIANAVTATANANAAKAAAEVATAEAIAAKAAAVIATANANAAKDAAIAAVANAVAATASTQAAGNYANTMAVTAQDTILLMQQLMQNISVEASLAPIRMLLEYPAKITVRNTNEKRIIAKLLPAYAMQNVIYLSDDIAVEVAPDGLIGIKKIGRSRIHIIPTDNTAIYQTIAIDVIAPSLRLLSASRVRLVNNNISRLT
jgi:hypothetical protein